MNDFSSVLPELIENGIAITRKAWEKGYRIELEDGVLYKVEPNNIDRVPWAIEHQDILADDWLVYKE